MAKLSGANTNAIIQVASTFGTAVDGGAGDKAPFQITPNFGVDELTVQQIGTGVTFEDFAARGNFKPTLSLSGDAGYANTMDFIIAAMFGTASISSELTASQGDYRHTITWNTTSNQKYLTCAYESSTTTVIEYPSCSVTSISLNADEAPGILQFSAEMIANNAVITSTTNTNADLQAATIHDRERIAFGFDDLFRINTASGSTLSGSDNVAITSFALTLNRPQDMIGEIRGSAGNSAPIDTDISTGTLTVTLKELADHTWFTIWSAETPQKATLNIQGTQIGSGQNRAITIYLPRLVLVQEPDYAITSAGVNPVTLTFKIIAASSNPSGMSSTYPYFEIINTRTAALLA